MEELAVIGNHPNDLIQDMQNMEDQERAVVQIQADDIIQEGATIQTQPHDSIQDFEEKDQGNLEALPVQPVSGVGLMSAIHYYGSPEAAQAIVDVVQVPPAFCTGGDPLGAARWLSSRETVLDARGVPMLADQSTSIELLGDADERTFHSDRVTPPPPPLLGLQEPPGLEPFLSGPTGAAALYWKPEARPQSWAHNPMMTEWHRRPYSFGTSPAAKGFGAYNSYHDVNTHPGGHFSAEGLNFNRQVISGGPRGHQRLAQHSNLGRDVQPRLPPPQRLAELSPTEQDTLLRQVPRDTSGKITSIGSIRHGTAECLPCLFWFKGTCAKGVRCTYCHFRHKGQKKKRIRPSKSTRLRLRELATTDSTAYGSEGEDASQDEDEEQEKATVGRIDEGDAEACGAECEPQEESL